MLTYFIAIKMGYANFSFTEMLKALTPISSEKYWFATAYVLLYLSIPLLNKIIAVIHSKDEFKRILFVMLTLTSVLPTVLYWTDPALIQGGYSYIWFIVLYFVAAYIRIYDVKIRGRVCTLVYLGLAITVPFTRIGAEYIQSKIGATTFVDNVMDYKMPVTLIMSVAFFLLFKNRNIKNAVGRKVISALAPMSFGVYLLHDSEYIRQLLWEKINMTQFTSVGTALLYMAFAVLTITVSGYVTSFLYGRLYAILRGKKIEKRIDKLVGGCGNE